MFSPYLSSSFFPFSFFPPTTIFLHYLFLPFFVSWFFISSFFSFPHSYQLPLSLSPSQFTFLNNTTHRDPCSLPYFIFLLSSLFHFLLSSIFLTLTDLPLSHSLRVYFLLQHHPAQNQCCPFCSRKPHLSSPPLCSSLSLNTTNPRIKALHHAPPASPLFTPPHLLSQLKNNNIPNQMYLLVQNEQKGQYQLKLSSVWDKEKQGA